MADTTYAVKVSDEVKIRLQKLVDDSGSSSKDFFADMISQFELINTRKQTPILAADIDELVKLTTRINNIFINVGERVSSLQETNRQDTEKTFKDKDGLISLLQQQILALKQEIAETDIQMTEYINENDRLNGLKESSEKLYATEINQLKEVNQKNNEIIIAHNEKIETLNVVVSESKNLSTENKLLQEKLVEVQTENERLKKDLKENEYQKREFELDRDKTILEQREKYNQELEKVQAAYHEKINQLLQTNNPKKDVKKQVEPKAIAQDDFQQG